MTLILLYLQNLSWSSHYSKICKAAYNALHLIKRNLTPTADVSTRHSLYLALVRSKLSYCSQLWSPCTVKDSTTLEAIQRRASKYILSTSTISYRDRLIQLRLLPLFYWLDLQDLLFLVKCFLFPPDNFDIFSYVSFCKPGSRSGTSGKLFCSSHRLSSSRHFYFARVVRLWNKLPSVDLLKSYNTIKKRINVHLWSRFVTHFNSNHFICPCSNYCNYTATAIIAVWSIKWYMHCKCIFMHLYLYHVLFENLLLLIILSEDLSWSTAKSIFYGITFFSRFMIGSLAPFTFSFPIMSQAA